MEYKSPKYLEPTDECTVGSVIELFAGVGGFRIALARSGWKTIFSNQWEPSTKSQPASDCYVHNFGLEGHTNENLTELIKRHEESGGKVVPKADLIVGGFPCQDYSVARTLNNSKGLEGKKGVLWWDIHKLIASNEPRYVFLENVDRLLNSPSGQRGRDFAIMLKTLGSLDYLIEWRVVNAADYGFPQRRKRVFIVATRTSKRENTSFDALACITREGVLARALPVKRPKTLIREISLHEAPDVLSESFGLGSKKSPFENSGVFLDGTAYTLTSEARSSRGVKTLGNILQREPVEESFWIDQVRISEWRALKGAKRIRREHKGSGTEYFYAEGAMAFPDLTTRPSRTILTGEGGSSPSRFKHIIKIGNRHRRLTPVEL